MVVRTLAQLRATPTPEWVWRGFVLPSNLTILSASPKAGKTTLLFHLLRALFHARPLFDQPTRPVPVLYVSEEPDSMLAARADTLEFSDAWNIGWITLEPSLQWSTVVTHMRDAVRTWGNPLVIVDTLPRFWGVADENDAVEVDRALRPVFDILRTSQASFVGVQHVRKAGGTGGRATRGSNALIGAADIALELWPLNPYDKSNKRRIDTYSRWGDTPPNFQIDLTSNGYVLCDSALVELERSIISLLGEQEGVTSEDVTEGLNVGLRYAQQALAGLHARGILVRQGTGKRTPFIYSLPGRESGMSE